MFTFFSPGKQFPSVSITGSECTLDCQHCGKHYLDGMIDARTPEVLYSTLKHISNSGAIGALISGGSTREGKVPLASYLPVLGRIKRETDLILNVHTGFIQDQEAHDLQESGVDVVSIDVVGDRETYRAVYGLDKGPSDIRETITALRDAGIPHIVPHVTIGLHFGKIKGEINALDLIRDILDPAALVVNVLIPTRGTSMEKIHPVDDDTIIRVLEHALSIFSTPVFLGCMRPKGNSNLEIRATRSGISGIVLPSGSAKNEINSWPWMKTRTVNTCCAVLSLLEDP